MYFRGSPQQIAVYLFGVVPFGTGEGFGPLIMKRHQSSFTAVFDSCLIVVSETAWETRHVELDFQVSFRASGMKPERKSLEGVLSWAFVGGGSQMSVLWTSQSQHPWRAYYHNSLNNWPLPEGRMYNNVMKNCYLQSQARALLHHTPLPLCTALDVWPLFD